MILLAGLQGSGKTTTAGKLARLLATGTKKKVLLVSTDVYRPAAIEQLATLAEQARGRPLPVDPSQKPVEIARAALDWARKHYHDVLIVDTAGRLAIDEAMMAEIARAARRGEAGRDAVRGRLDAGPGRGQRRAARSTRRCRSPA